MEELCGRISAGHLRSIVGSLTVEEIIRERDKVAQEVKDMLPALVEAAAGAISGSHLTVQNGSEGMNEVAAGIVGQGLTVFDTLRRGLVSGNGDVPTSPPRAAERDAASAEPSTTSVRSTSKG
jgi:hypothetical protein